MEQQSGFTPSLSTVKMEDDNIFGPPALSAYSIAILSASSQGRPSSGTLSEAEIKDNTELKNSLKRKFSVQFADTDSSILQSRTSFEARDTKTLVNTEHNAHTSNNNNSAHYHNHNQSLNNHNQDSNEGNTSHGYSPGLTNTSSGSSYLGRTGLSPITHDSFSAYNENMIDTLTQKLAVQPEATAIESVKETTISTPNSSLIPGLLANNINLHKSIPLRSIGQTMKKSRLLHNPRSLGPPKRASEIEAVQTESTNCNLKLETPTAEFSTTEEEPLRNRNAQKRYNPFTDGTDTINMPIIAKNNPYLENSDHLHATISNKSDFFESLKNLKKRSPEKLTSISSLIESPMKSNYLKRDIVNQRSFGVLLDNNSSTDMPSKSWTSAKVEKKRLPLNDISLSAVNMRSKDPFIKPSKPRLSLASISRDTITRPEPVKHISDPEIQNSSKKVIVVNGQLYEKLELLGRGGSSKVYKVRHTGTKKIYAIKKVDYDQFDESCIKGFKSEIEHLIKLRDHSRVVFLEDHKIEDSSIFLVMECGELDLAHVLQRRMAGEPILDVNFVRFQAVEMFRCVQAVHQAGIVHSDLKPANFLFVRGFMKIIDFGIANAVPEHTTNIYRESQIGTPNYMAPETLIECGQASCPTNKESTNTWKVGKPSDVWSCGCIIYQMIYGKPPYASFSGLQRIKAIMDPETKILYPEVGLGGGWVPKSAIILMQGCLDRFPRYRWSIDECLNSDFLKPKVVSRAYIRDLIYSAVNYGMERKDEVSRDTYDQLVETVVNQIEDLNFA